MIEPLVTPFIAKIFLPASKLTEPVDRFSIAGLCFGIAGTALSATPTIVSSGDSNAPVFLALCAGASIVFALGTVVSQAFGSKRPVVHRITGQMFFGVVFLIPVTSVLRATGVFEDWSGREPISYLWSNVGWETWVWMIALSTGKLE
jgi:drug/metabolite transporter (DMT)-like permease